MQTVSNGSAVLPGIVGSSGITQFSVEFHHNRMFFMIYDKRELGGHQPTSRIDTDQGDASHLPHHDHESHLRMNEHDLEC